MRTATSINQALEERQRQDDGVFDVDKPWDEFFADLQAYSSAHNPHGYTEADIPRLIKETREEMRKEEQAKQQRAA